ncbi:thiamine pyrophosphate-dependent dehydrogenase E1 component subunit alpha [Kitasatospora sp. NBC_00315]|uniref:thiamine pyrophosphate-dependent dehydrogenase E1 component subunit alpha n=1 Tax=Kitasatospora sp. NBC_00315 TaxID=2975963 RepID=UPI003254BE43
MASALPADPALPPVDARPVDGFDPVAAYRTMVLIRTYEERILQARTEREVIGPVHPYIGQEAVAVGVCAALEPRDHLVSHYRGHGHALARGVDPDALTAELFGRADGLCGGKAAALVSDPATHLLLSSGIVGAGIPVAAGAAMTSQVKGDGAVAVVFFGEGALGAGVVHETLTLAVVQRLPLILVCENNGYQGATRTEEVYPETSVARIAEAHRMPVHRVDGNDTLAVHAAATAAVAAARAGQGPSFIEASTYLTRFHLQFDRPSGEHRPAEERADWLARDPLGRLRQHLLAAGTAPAVLDALDTDAEQRVDAAITFARTSPWPAPEAALTNLWAATP